VQKIVPSKLPQLTVLAIDYFLFINVLNNSIALSQSDLTSNGITFISASIFRPATTPFAFLPTRNKIIAL
jgi:hypothetical protein